MRNVLLKLLMPALGAGLLLLPLESQALDLLPGFMKSGTDKGMEVWSSGEQYVRLVPQGKVHGKAPAANDQPVHLGLAQLRKALGAIDRVDSNARVASAAATTPVFSSDELDVLTPALVHGLAEAKPDQDVVFMVKGVPDGKRHGKLQAVAGRVFFRKGRLNLIFGDVGRLVGFSAIQDLNGYDVTPDRRTHPIRVGERAKPIPHDWVLSLSQGMRFHDASANVLRDDWLEMDIPKVLAGLQPPAGSKRQRAAAPAAPVVTAAERRELRKQTAELVAQRQQMQLQMAQMQKELNALHRRRNEMAAAPKGAVARLSMLDKLRREKLITQQEYDAKRREILGKL